MKFIPKVDGVVPCFNGIQIKLRYTELKFQYSLFWLDTRLVEEEREREENEGVILWNN